MSGVTWHGFQPHMPDIARSHFISCDAASLACSPFSPLWTGILPLTVLTRIRIRIGRNGTAGAACARSSLMCRQLPQSNRGIIMSTKG